MSGADVVWQKKKIWICRKLLQNIFGLIVTQTFWSRQTDLTGRPFFKKIQCANHASVSRILKSRRVVSACCEILFSAGEDPVSSLKLPGKRKYRRKPFSRVRKTAKTMPEICKVQVWEFVQNLDEIERRSDWA